MPIYDYVCDKCEKDFEVLKSIKEYDGKDTCPKCGIVGRRLLSCNIEFLGTKIEDAEYNPGLGQITKGKRHRDELAKRAGLVEIGNESTDSIHKHADQTQADIRKRRWESV